MALHQKSCTHPNRGSTCRMFHCQFQKQASLEDNLGFLQSMLKELCK